MSAGAAALERAIALAVSAHRGQRYPSPEAEPYIHHPLRVMLNVRGFRAQMAVVLHDVLEDTDVGLAGLRETDRPELSYEEYIEGVARNDLAREVKLADLADNLANNRRLERTAEVLARIDRYEHAVDRLRRSVDGLPVGSSHAHRARGQE